MAELMMQQALLVEMPAFVPAEEDPLEVDMEVVAVLRIARQREYARGYEWAQQGLDVSVCSKEAEVEGWLDGSEADAIERLSVWRWYEYEGEW